MQLKDIIRKSILELKNSGIKSPEIDIQILLREAMQENDAFIFSHPSYLLTNNQYTKFRKFVRRRKKGEPIAYIIGKREFYGLDFFVNKNVLIPRPETEELVEKALNWLKAKSLKPENNLNIIDMGTGSGNIIISLAHNLQLESHNYFATDISKRAIEVAKKNARSYGIDKQIKFYHSDLFSNRLVHKKFDLVLANLPYVPQNSQKEKSEIDFEPYNAIFADHNGTEIIKNFLIQAKNFLSSGGVIILELDPRNAKSLEIFAQKLFTKNFTVQLEKDLSKKNRFLTVASSTRSS